MKRYIIEKSKVNEWLKQIIKSTERVLAPVKDGEKVYFRPITSPQETDYDSVTTTESAKETVFPRTETLFRFKTEGKDTTLSEVSAESYPQTVLWRARPCDAVGFLPLDAIFNWDYKDNIYNLRRAKLTIVSFSCNTSDSYCFCTSVGGGPGNTEGTDILVTLLNDERALAEAVTEKGEKLISLCPTLFKAVESDEGKSSALAKIPSRFTSEQVQEHLKNAFDSSIWKQQSARCIGCGACAFVCPTCACFDIQDDKCGRDGKRIRCWDSCGFSLFTKHTSGYNPRPEQSMRWRQRLLHKFSYMPDRIKVLGCTGCGRCSRACPVDMNIAEHLYSIANYNHEK